MSQWDSESRRLRRLIEDNSDKTLVTLPSGAAVQVGDLCTMSTSGDMILANASDESTCKSLMAVANQAGGIGDQTVFALRGTVSYASAFSPGDLLYASTTAGDITTTAPEQVGEIVRLVGYALSSSEIFFDPDRTWLELG